MKKISYSIQKRSFSSSLITDCCSYIYSFIHMRFQILILLLSFQTLHEVFTKKYEEIFHSVLITNSFRPWALATLYVALGANRMGHLGFSFLSWVVLIQAGSPGLWYLVSRLVMCFCELNKWFRFKTFSSGQILFQEEFQADGMNCGETADSKIKKLPVAEILKWPPRLWASLGL